MSDIYCNVLQENFTLSAHICSLVVDVLTKNAVFSFLADKHAGLSYEHVAHKLAQTIEWSGHIHRSQVDALALVGVAYASDKEGYCKLRANADVFLAPENSVKRRVTTDGDFGPMDALAWLRSTRSKTLDVRSFAQASSASNEVSMHALLHVMESHGKAKYLEKFFVPWVLRNVYKLSRALERERHPAGTMPLGVDASDAYDLDSDKDTEGEEQEDNGKEEETSCNQIANASACRGTILGHPEPDLEQDNKDDKLIKIMDHLKQLQERTDQLQVTFESRFHSWTEQMEQHIFQQLRVNINNGERITNSDSSHSNNITRHTPLESELPNLMSVAHKEGNHQHPTNVDLWLENLHASVDSLKVNRILAECKDSLRSIVRVSAQAARTEASELQAVSQHFGQLACVDSLCTDAVTQGRIAMMQSIMQDCAVSVRQNTTNIIDMCSRLHHVDRNEAPGRDAPSRTSASLVNATVIGAARAQHNIP